MFGTKQREVVRVSAMLSIFFGGTESGLGNEFRHIQGGSINDIAFFDADLGCTAEDGGRIRRTANGGASWSFAETPDSVRRDLFGVCWVTDDISFACGELGVVLKSTNGGSLWTIATTTDGPVTDAYEDEELEVECGERLASLQDIFMISATHGWVVGLDGSIAKTTDGWVNWERVDFADLPGDFHCGADPHDSYQPVEKVTWSGILAGDIARVHRSSY